MKARQISLWLFMLVGLLLAGHPSFTQANPCAGRDFSAIDRHATNAPPAMEVSLQTLAAYLVKPAHDDLEKARAIFRWIAARISYDMALFKAADRHNQKAEELLKSRKGICGCYVNLFQRLAELAGLQCVSLSGYSKGFGYKPDADVKQNKHGWIAVRINGAWQLVDPTWGSGYMDEQEQFCRRCDDYFFCVSPRELIQTHFPDNPEFQLLPTRITLKEFEELVYLYPAFLRTGLRVGSHPKGRIETGADLRVTLQGSNATFLMAALSQNGKELSRNLAFVQNAMGTFEIMAVFPTPGDYLLRLFARQKDAVTDKPGEFQAVMEYAVKASAGKGDPGRIGFPQYFRDFTCGKVRLYEPFTGFLKAGSTKDFKLAVPGAVKVAVIMNDGKDFVNLKRSQTFEGKVRVAAGEIKLGAMFPGDKGYRTLLVYTGY